MHFHTLVTVMFFQTGYQRAKMAPNVPQDGTSPKPNQLLICNQTCLQKVLIYLQYMHTLSRSVHLHTYICMYAHTVQIRASTHIHMYVCTHCPDPCIYTHTYVHMHILSRSMHLHTYSMYVCTHCQAHMWGSATHTQCQFYVCVHAYVQKCRKKLITKTSLSPYKMCMCCVCVLCVSLILAPSKTVILDL